MSTAANPITDDPQRTFGFRVAHAAFRRDVDRLVRAVPRVATPDDAIAVAAWFSRFEAILTHHHEVEDECWWPPLAEAVDGFASRQAAMLDEHHRLVEELTATRAALADLTEVAAPERPGVRRTAAAAAVSLERATVAHLDAEEAAVFPALTSVDASVVAGAQKQSNKRDSLAMARYALPWALDGIDPALDAEVRSSLPAVLRIVLPRWQRRYRREVAHFAELSV